MLGGADQNEKAAFQAQRPSIQNRRLMFDNASSAQLANPVPNRRLGRPHFAGNFVQGLLGIDLQFAKELVDRLGGVENAITAINAYSQLIAS